MEFTKIKKVLLWVVMALAITFVAAAIGCETMSDQEAYDLGYSIGSSLW